MLDIIFILDESTSMNDHIHSYINGVNMFLNTQKSQNPQSKFTLVKFSNDVDILCIDKKMHTLQEFTTDHYNPAGVTALYDAIGYAVTLKYNSNINSIDSDNNGDRVVVIILTDGEDNHSSNYTLENITDKIEYLKNRGWVFIFIAANQNVIVSGIRMGIDIRVAYSASEQSITQVADACNIAIGHAVQKWTNVPNIYSDKEMPDDLRDLLEGFNNCKI